MKIALTIICLLFAAVTFAQPGQGQFMLNAAGNGTFAGSSPSDYRSRTYTAHLSGYYFVTEKFAVGLQAENHFWGTSRRFGGNQPYNLERKLYQQRLGPVARYYIKTGRKTAFFAQASAGLAMTQVAYRSSVHGRLSPAPGHEIPNFSGGFAHVTPGFAWFPTQRLAIEFTALEIGYNMKRNADSSTNTKFGLNKLNAKLGVSYTFGKSRDK